MKIYKADSKAPFNDEEAQYLGEYIKKTCGDSLNVYRIEEHSRDETSPFYKYIKDDTMLCQKLNKIRKICQYLVTITMEAENAL